MSQNKSGVSGVIQQKFQTAIAAVKATLIGRTTEVDVSFVALVANENVAMIGDPGTAKSALVTNIGRCFSDQRVFTRLLGKFVLPEAVMGPNDTVRLKDGFYNRKTKGYMPDATVAFLDEGFKASESLLNSLLTLTNEREFDIGEAPAGQPSGRVTTDLGSTFVASNEVPEGSSMDALWDRFLLRLWVTSLSVNDDWALQMLDRAVDYPIRTADRKTASHVVRLPAGSLLTLAELDEAQRVAQSLPVTAAARTAAMEWRREVHAKFPGLLTDRTWMRLWSLPRAVAFLEGASEVRPDHLEILTATLWRDPTQRAGLTDIVFKFCNPIGEEVRRIVDNIREIATSTWPTQDLASGDKGQIMDAQKACFALISEMDTNLSRLATVTAGTSKYDADTRIAQGYRDASQRKLNESLQSAFGVNVPQFSK